MLNWLKTTKLHFIGIGGIGMSGIAEVLLDLGCSVSGSDLGQSSVTENLKQKGAKIFLGHQGSNVEGSSLIVFSSAIDTSNPEVARALELGIPLIRRAEMLAELMRLKLGIAVAGSHGKTTTTSLVATIFDEARLDATHIIGGVVRNLGGNARKGDSHYLIAEADESDGSFLLLSPIMAAITNIDDDHLDHYKSKEHIVAAFRQFINRLPFYGVAVMNANDEASLSLRAELQRPVMWFGIELEPSAAAFVARDLQLSASGTKFDLYHRGKKVRRIETNLLGRHNVSNTLAAIALCHQNEISWDLIQSGLAKFQGVGRRLERIFENERMVVLDDYGHHPTEIRATISTLKQVDVRPLCVIFEPHRYTRTKSFWVEFQEALSEADEVYISPVYAASEKPLEGVTSRSLVDEMQKRWGNVHYLNSLDELPSVLNQHLERDCVFLTLGAGAISRRIRDCVRSL